MAIEEEVLVLILYHKHTHEILRILNTVDTIKKRMEPDMSSLTIYIVLDRSSSKYEKQIQT